MSKKAAELSAFYIMAVVGGVFGGYTIISVGQLGAAQSTNLITLIMSIFGKDMNQLLARLGLLAAFAVGTAATRIIKERCKSDVRIVSIIIDFICTATVAAIPDETNAMLELYPIVFGMAFQYTSFTGALGFASASVFSSNNFRQFIDSGTDYLCTKKKEAGNKFLFFGGSLLFYHIGVIASVAGVLLFGKVAIVIAFAPIAAALPIVLAANRKNA